MMAFMQTSTKTYRFLGLWPICIVMLIWSAASLAKSPVNRGAVIAQ